MKKILSLILAIGITAAALVGCGEEKTGSDGGTEGLSGTVATDGSTSMETVIEFLKEGFTEENKDVKVTYNPTGSSAGIQAVSEGRCDIGLASRDLRDDEKAELTGTVVAIDGIAIIVNKENGVKNLTLDQIAKIYKGEITNWKDVGGADAQATAVSYGKANAAVYTVYAFLMQLVTLRCTKIQIEPDFITGESRIYLSGKLFFRIGTVLAAGLAASGDLLRLLLGGEKAQKTAVS